MTEYPLLLEWDIIMVYVSFLHIKVLEEVGSYLATLHEDDQAKCACGVAGWWLVVMLLLLAGG